MVVRIDRGKGSTMYFRVFRRPITRMSERMVGECIGPRLVITQSPDRRGERGDEDVKRSCRRLFIRVTTLW